MSIWNPWRSCRKISEGCLNCYMFRRDALYDKDSTIVTKTANFIKDGRRYLIPRKVQMTQARRANIDIR